MTHQTRNALYAMLAPFLVGTVVLVLLPVLVTIWLSLQNYDALTPPGWAGLGNYKIILNYRAFTLAAQNTITFVIFAVPLRILAMLALALLFNRPRRGVRLFRVAIYVPMVVPDVAFALMWLWIFNPAVGPVNFLLRSVGLPGPAWMVDMNTFFWLLLIMSLFQVGEGFVVFLAALRDVPDEYYHVAAIDGATRSQAFRYITFPLLRPWLTLLIFRDIIVGAPAVFTPAIVMMRQVRDDPTWFLPQMIYEEAFSRLRFGVAAAVMVSWLVITGALFFLAFRFVRGWGYADEL